MGQASDRASVSRLVGITVPTGYLVAAAIVAIRLIGGDFPFIYELPGALTLGAIAATPPTLALLGRYRPGLLLPAGLTAVLSLPVLSIFGLVMVPLGIAWLAAYAKFRGSIIRALVALLAVTGLWIAAAAVPFVHLDPRCVQTLDDGTVRQIEAFSFESGWVWDTGPTIVGSSFSAGEVVEEVCGSDVVTPLEMAVALGLLAAALGIGWVLVEPASQEAGLTA
jgi:hypothetical protein